MSDATDGRPSDLEFWRLPTVIAKTGLSKGTIYRRMAEGTFPRNYPYRSGPQSRFWRSDEVEAWQRQEVDTLEGLIG